MDSTLTDPKYIYADILIALAQADNEVHEREKAMLTDIFANMGLEGETVESMWLTPRTLDVIASVLKDIDDENFKRCLLKDCYLLAWADDKFVPEESAFIRKVREMMEIEPVT